MLKDFQVDLELSPKDNRVIQTGATYWSHDVNTAKINIKLLRHSEPVILNKDVTVRVMMLFDDENKSEHIYTAKIEDEKAGIVSVILDKNVRSYIGQVICGVYADYGAEQKTDNGYFTFAMKRSLIDKRMPEMKQYYVSDFEDTLAKMKLTNAEFAEVETKLNNRIDVIEKDIESNEIAKKSDITAAIEKVDNLRIVGQNLILNSNEAKWNKANSDNVVHTSGITVNEWNTSEAINVKGNVTKAGNILTLTTGQGLSAVKGKRYTHSIYIRNNTDNSFELWNNIGNLVKINGKETKRFIMTSDGTSSVSLQFILKSGTVNEFDFDYFHPMIEEGTRANDWGLSINDIAIKKDIIALQKQIDDIKKAITHLGGTL